PLVKQLFGISDNLRYEWNIDSKKMSSERDYSLKLSSGEHKIGLKVSDDRKQGYTEKTVSIPKGENFAVMQKVIEVDPDELYSLNKLDNIPLKGICYDAGIKWDYNIKSWRNLTNEQIEREVIDIINRELDCNAVRIMGNDDNIFRVADIAIEKGNFDVIAISPRFISETMDNTIIKIADVAKKTEEVRKKFNNTTFIVGNELPIDNRGVVSDAPTYKQRSDEAGKYMSMLKYQNRLNKFLKKLITVASQNFKGEITYASTWWEQGIRWEDLDFDIISLNQYYHPEYNDENDIISILEEFRQLGKKIYITEFGCATFEGAFEAGGAGWDPNIYGNKKYSQEEQSKAIKWYVDFFTKTKILDGIFLANFIDIVEDDRASFGILRCKYLDSKYKNGWTKSKPERKLGFYMYKSFKI
ncbi:MAG: hypothetical protein ACE5K0_09750, partial [Candidatus Methanofastidiosia archaeon]